MTVAFWSPVFPELHQEEGTEIEGYKIGQNVRYNGEIGTIRQIVPNDYVLFLTLEFEGMDTPIVVYDDEVEEYYDPFEN